MGARKDICLLLGRPAAVTVTREEETDSLQEPLRIDPLGAAKAREHMRWPARHGIEVAAFGGPQRL